ncbi:MAG: LysE family transporter [Nitrospirota bacterium]
MRFILFITAAFVMGCIAAIPAGPVQIEVIRRSIHGHVRAALMFIFGAFCVDVFYGTIAFFGIAPFLERKEVMAWFGLIGGVILIILGILGIRHSAKEEEINAGSLLLKKKRWSLLGGISLSVMNPVMILWWLTSAHLFREIGLIPVLTSDFAASFIIAGSLGLASYLVALSLFINWAKKYISPPTIRKINFVFSIFLLLLATYFIISSFRHLAVAG